MTEVKKEAKPEASQAGVAAEAQETKDPKAEPKKTTAKKATKKQIKVLKIVAKREGFRRAGIEFGSDEKVINVSDLKPAQVAMLKSEKMLMVSETTVAPE